MHLKSVTHHKVVFILQVAIFSLLIIIVFIIDVQVSALAFPGESQYKYNFPIGGINEL